MELRDYPKCGAKQRGISGACSFSCLSIILIRIISTMDDHPDPLLQFFSATEFQSSDILYTTLELQSTCSADEIKRAYRKAALRLHPDKHATKSDTVRQEMSKEFQKVGFAYAVLGDEVKRKRCVTSRQNSSFDCYCRLIGRTGTMRPAGLMTFPLPMPSQWDGMHISNLCINVSTGRCSTKTKLGIKVKFPLLSERRP